MSNWENDISGLTLAWLLNVRQALNEDGPIAREHFRFGCDELADQLAAMHAEQVHRMEGPPQSAQQAQDGRYCGH